MGEPSQQTRLAEYTTLRDEILQNKKYVFERPLLIIAAAGVASFKLSGEPSLALLPALFIFVLLSNLWFTVNRLQSNARIIAYISLVLESDHPFNWTGWENALRTYRIWKKKNGAEGVERVQNRVVANAVPDAMMFYPALWLVHIAAVLIAVVSSGFATANNLRLPTVLAFGLTILTSIVFFIYSFGPNRPKHMRGLIENQRAMWETIFEEGSTGKSCHHAGKEEASSALSPDRIT